MQKVSKVSDVYKPNKRVTVTVKNNREEDFDSGAVTYNRSVTIKINDQRYASEPLRFDDDDSIAKYIEGVDFEDPNTTLDVGDGDET